MYGAFWCPHCDNQKRLFGDGWKYVRYVECSLQDRTQSQACSDAGITAYPTWEFPGGSRVEGALSLAQIEKLSGCEPVPEPRAPLAFSGPREALRATEGEEFHYAFCGVEGESDCPGYGGQSDPSGGMPPYAFGSSDLPAGLELRSNGVLWGVPSQPGEYSIPVCVADSVGETSCQWIALTIAEEPQPPARSCSVDTDCAPPGFCEGGVCALPDRDCETNSDCILLDWQYRVPCCNEGACDSVDFSAASVIAVNGAWLAEMSALYCPQQRECGPRPGCPSMIVDTGYHAACVSWLCEKVPGAP